MTDDQLRPLETRYAGCRFRSRLEARWAVFFDQLDVDWEYEPEGFATPAGPYLPDFRIRIPQMKDHDHYQWFEVKPPKAPIDPRHAAMSVDAPLIVARGLPRSYGDQMRGRQSPLMAYGIDCGATPVAFCDSTSNRTEQYCALGDNRHWCQEDMNNTLDDRYERCHLALYGWHGPVVADTDILDDDEEWYAGAERWAEDMRHGFMTFPPYEAHNIDRAYAAARSARFDR